MTVKMHFNNISSLEFHRVFSFAEDPGLMGHNKVPAKVMKAKHGDESLDVTQDWLEWMADGDSDFSVKWFPSAVGENNPDYHNGFGLKIHSPVQVFGIGARPRFAAGYYWSGKIGSYSFGGFVWDEMKGDENAQTFTFPFLDGYSVEVSPTSEKSSMTLMVKIRDAL